MTAEESRAVVLIARAQRELVKDLLGLVEARLATVDAQLVACYLAAPPQRED